MSDRYDPEMALVRAEMYLPAAARPLVQEVRALRALAGWCRAYVDGYVGDPEPLAELEAHLGAVDAVTGG